MTSVVGFGRCFELRRTGGVAFVAFGVAAPPPGVCCEERRGWLETRRCGFGDATGWRRVVWELYRGQKSAVRMLQ